MRERERDLQAPHTKVAPMLHQRAEANFFLNPISHLWAAPSCDAVGCDPSHFCYYTLGVLTHISLSLSRFMHKNHLLHAPCFCLLAIGSPMRHFTFHIPCLPLSAWPVPPFNFYHYIDRSVHLDYFNGTRSNQSFLNLYILWDLISIKQVNQATKTSLQLFSTNIVWML